MFNCVNIFIIKKMPITLQSNSTESRIARCFLSHFLSTCDTILTVTGFLWFGIDSHLLTSESTFLMHWASWSYSFESGSSHLCLRATDDATVRQS